MEKINIELKCLKHSPLASQETNCFSAKMYVNGQHIANVFNNGCGGATIFQCHSNQKLMISAENYCKSLPKFMSDGTALDMDLDFYVSLLVERMLNEKSLKRLLKNHVVMLEDGQVYQLKSAGKMTAVTFAQAQQKYPTAIILNTLPLNQALNLFTSCSYEPLMG